MIVIPDMTLKLLMQQIVEASHGLCNDAGEPHTLSTISPSNLRMAAICAMQIASGVEVWPGDKTIKIKRPGRVRHGIFEEEG